MRAWVLCVPILALTCSGPEPLPPEPAAVPPDAVTIRLERLDGERWSLAYTLSRSVDALDLGPAVGELRGAAWRPEEGFEIVADEDGERLRRRDGASFEAVTLELATWDELVPKQYVPFNTFSDGGVSVYTGFLAPELVVAGEHFEPAMRFELVPRAGEAVVVAGARTAGPVRWSPPDDTPAFVYFGAAVPIETEALLAIVDPSTPAALAERFADFLPRAFAYLAERFGRRLPVRPTVFVSARFDDGNRGRSLKGGALDGQIQVRLRGEELREPDAGVREHLHRFIAHEAAHLWQRSEAFDNATAWIHEGGAEALALRTVEELGAWPPERVAQEVDEAAERCVGHLEAGVVLATAAEAGAFDALYDCGLVIALASEALLEQADPDADLFTLWGELVVVADAAGDTFSADTYFATLADLGVSPDRSRPLRDLLAGPPPDPRAAVRALLAVPAPTP